MITINTNPSGNSSVQDALWHVVTTDVTGQTDFKFVFDIFINGEQKVRVKQYPEPGTLKGYFDAGTIVRNEFTYEWFVPTESPYGSQPDASGQMALTYQLRVGEDYSGITTLNMASGNTKVFNYAPPLFKRRIINIGDKLNKWLTNRPLVINAKLGDNIFIPFHTNDTTLRIQCSTYDSSNTLIATESDATTQSCQDGFIQSNIGSNAIMNELPITINSAVKYYTVNFEGFDSVRVNLICQPKYNTIPLHFVNRWGMYDTLLFDLVSRLSMDVERKGFEKRDYRFSGNNVTYYDNFMYHEGKINHLNKAAFTYRLTADALTDAEWEWAAELIYSPKILMEIDGYYYPVTIKNTNYEFSKWINNKLRPLELDVNVNQDRYSHLR